MTSDDDREWFRHHVWSQNVSDDFGDVSKIIIKVRFGLGGGSEICADEFELKK